MSVSSTDPGDQSEAGDDSDRSEAGDDPTDGATDDPTDGATGESVAGAGSPETPDDVAGPTRQSPTGRRRRHRRRPPWWLVGPSVLGLVAVAVLVTYHPTPALAVRAGDIGRAVVTLEAKIGRGRRYTEINATPDGVNLFVVQPDGQEQAWFYADGALHGPGNAAAAPATAFVVGDIDLGLAPKIARSVLDRFPRAKLTGFALVEQQGHLVWSARSMSSRGGTVEAFFTTDGQLLGGSLR